MGYISDNAMACCEVRSASYRLRRRKRRRRRGVRVKIRVAQSRCTSIHDVSASWLRPQQSTGTLPKLRAHRLGAGASAGGGDGRGAADCAQPGQRRVAGPAPGELLGVQRRSGPHRERVPAAGVRQKVRRSLGFYRWGQTCPWEEAVLMRGRTATEDPATPCTAAVQLRKPHSDA